MAADALIAVGLAGILAYAGAGIAGATAPVSLPAFNSAGSWTVAFLAPPVRFAAEATLPPAALCAFDLLFGEGGGYVSDVYGKSFDVLAEAGAPIYSGASAAPQRGLLACADAMHPYFVRATSVAFPRQKSELQRLSDNLCVKGEYDGPPLRLVDDENSDFDSS